MEPAARVLSESRILYDTGSAVRVLDNTMIDQSDVHLDVSQSVVVYFRFAGDDLAPIYALEQALTKAIADAGVGVYDGHEVALLDGDDAYLFMYGPDADTLFAAVRTTLDSVSLMRGAKAILRYGATDDETADQRHVVIWA
jgi:hypothetical protein